MQKQIRWGMIGCGAVTEVKSGPAYHKTPAFELYGVTRRDQALAKDYALRHKIPCVYASADELINCPDIDAVYIATPPDSHLALALKVAEAGKPCCIEKPLAPTYQQSKQIMDTFAAKNIAVFVAYYRRSLPRFNKVKALIEDAAIGNVRHITWHLNKPANPLDLSGTYNWRTDKQVAPGGYFDDLASHGLDLFAYLLGDYEAVSGIATNQQKLYDAFDAVSACWQHKAGITGSGSWNFGGFSRFDDVVIYGSKGEIRFSVFDECDIRVITEQGSESFTIANPDNIQLFHVQNMAESLCNSHPHPSTAQSATHTSWVMQQILNS
ncbi:Gfo/Idh/MocA family protein [Pseudoalteromonas atlantica]|uniref:Gfo/Idh/MocA family protein n=1 Tax=Pseudoalteromonas atlantica TaxID=288 RepID=UPI003735A769